MFDNVTGWGWMNYGEGSGLFRLVRTSDGGTSWLDVTPVDRFGVIRDFFLDSETAWVSDVKWSETNQWRSLYFTQNGGRSWELVSVPPEGIMWLYFIDAENGWATSGSFTLYQTVDSGRTWGKVLTDSPIDDHKFLFQTPTNVWISNDYASTTSNFKYLNVSWDGGITWEAKDMPFKHEVFSDADLVRVNLPVFFGDQVGYTTAQYRHQEGETVERLLTFFVTNDGGHAWTQISSVDQKLYGQDYVDFISPDIAFTTCEFALCVTKDGASTWQVVQLNDLQKNIFDEIDGFDVDFVTELEGWMLTWKTGVGVNLYFTDDGGKTWIPLPGTIYRKE